jgi:hypothetical protein
MVKRLVLKQVGHTAKMLSAMSIYGASAKAISEDTGIVYDSYGMVPPAPPEMPDIKEVKQEFIPNNRAGRRMMKSKKGK